MAIDIEGDGSFAAAAEEIGMDFRRRLFHLRRALPRSEIEVAVRVLCDWRAAALQALRWKFARRREAAWRAAAEEASRRGPARPATPGGDPPRPITPT